MGALPSFDYFDLLRFSWRVDPFCFVGLKRLKTARAQLARTRRRWKKVTVGFTTMRKATFRMPRKPASFSWSFCDACPALPAWAWIRVSCCRIPGFPPLLDQFVRVRLIKANSLDLQKFQFDPPHSPLYPLSTSPPSRGEGQKKRPPVRRGRVSKVGSWTMQRRMKVRLFH